MNNKNDISNSKNAFLFDPAYADQICANAYNEDKEYIDQMIKFLAKR